MVEMLSKMVGNTYKMACSQDPVEMQVLIRLDKAFGACNAFTIYRCSTQVHEGFKPRPSETSEAITLRFVS